MIAINTFNIETDQSLLEKLKNSAGWNPTAEELLQQRISFVMGSIGNDKGVTRSYVESEVRRYIGAAETPKLNP